jgi:hypothetical protein
MTAPVRRAPPVPLRWLKNHGYIQGKALDYGCGRYVWYDMFGYDPHWNIIPLDEEYDTVTCIYVLNTLSESEEKEVINKVNKLGKNTYFAVRRDLPKEGKLGRGCWQRNVILDIPLLYECSTYAIYKGKV